MLTCIPQSKKTSIYSKYLQECVFNFVKDYQTKDVKVQAIVNQIKSLYGQIDAIRGRAQLIASAGSGSMFGGGFGMENETGTSFLSDIKNFFGSMALPRGAGAGGINNQTTQILQQKDQDDIRRLFVSESPKSK